MNRIYLAVLSFLFIATVTAYPAAEVSQKKDIGIFPVFSSQEVPSAGFTYFDDKIVGMLSGMQRFQVIGYQYRLDGLSAEKFIEKIVELKKKKAMQSSEYIDADLGVAVIPAADMEKLTKSFFIFIPSISGYTSEEVSIEVKEKDRRGRTQIRIQKEYHVSVNLSIKIIKADGTLLDTYNASQETTSKTSPIEGYQEAVNKGIGGLELFLRNIPEFKLKTTVLEINPEGIAIELGKNLGIKPGYEFFVRKQKKVLDRFTEESYDGLIRVERVGDQISFANAIYGNPTEGDQLVEAPLSGIRFQVYGGMNAMNVTGSQISLMLLSYESVAPAGFTNRLTWKPSTFVPTFGVNVGYELGYAWLLDLNLGIYVNDPYGFYTDFGIGYEFRIGSFSVIPSLCVSGAGTIIDLGTVTPYVWMAFPTGGNMGDFDSTAKAFWGITEECYQFYNPAKVSLTKAAIGAKPKLTCSVQFGQNFRIDITGGYAYYLDIYSAIKIEGTGSETNKIATIDLGKQSSKVSFLVDGTSQSSLPMNWNGPFFGLEFVYRY